MDEEYEYEVVPLEGVGPVRLGMSREDSRAAMGLPPSQTSGPGERRYDHYLRNAFQVFFDEDDRVAYIELYRGDPVVALYQGRRVFDTPAAELVELVSRAAPFDPDDPELGYTYTFPALELALWRPARREDVEGEEDVGDEEYLKELEAEWRTFHTIGVGVRGYFSAG
jgi:hypothetical protein